MKYQLLYNFFYLIYSLIKIKLTKRNKISYNIQFIQNKIDYLLPTPDVGIILCHTIMIPISIYLLEF